MQTDQGSLERAVQGQYNINIGEVLAESWQKVSGAKLKIVGGLIIYSILALLVSALFSFFLDAEPYYRAAGVYDENALFYTSELFYKGTFIDMLKSWLAFPITVPLSLGVLLLGYARANDEALKVDTIFNYYTYVWPLVFAAFLTAILTYIGFLFFLLPGIYLSIAYSFTLPLIVDKKLDVWAAMEVSRQAVTKQWFSVFGIFVILGIITMLSAIPMGIGLIWSIPLLMIAHGVMYRKIFGWNIHDPLAEEG